MKTAREFLLAIRTTAPNELVNPGLDAEAEEVLERLCTRSIDAFLRNSSGWPLYRQIYYEGMLRGVQLQLRETARQAQLKGAHAGLLNEDGSFKTT